MISVDIEYLDNYIGEPLRYETDGAAGFDIRAAINEPIIMGCGSTQIIKAGFKVAIPEGYELQVRPRSGLALKEGITVLNSPGTVDSDYRGEVAVILHKVAKGTEFSTIFSRFTINPGDRIAQGVIAPIKQVSFNTTTLNNTTRGSEGFGSTGVK